MMHKRSASAAHHATVAEAEAVAHHLLAIDPVLSSGPPAANLRVLVPDAVDENYMDPHKRFKKPIFFKDAPNVQVFRSFHTDPSYLEDNSLPSLDSIRDLPLFPVPAFDSFHRFGSLIAEPAPSFCFRELELLERKVDETIHAFNTAVQESISAYNRSRQRDLSRRARSETRNNLDSDMMDVSPVEKATTPPSSSSSAVQEEAYHCDNPYISCSPSATIDQSTIELLRLVELPSAVGYIHWLQDLENAVDERLWYHSWRPKARFSQKIKNDKAPECLLLADPWRLHDLKSKTVLPCHSVEDNRILYKSCAGVPELHLSVWKILLQYPELPPPEIARHRLPMDGRWAPFPWSTLYEEEILYEEPPVEDGRKKRRLLSRGNLALEDADMDMEPVPVGKRRAAARAAAAVRSTFDDSGDEEELVVAKHKSPPASGRRGSSSAHQDDGSPTNQFTYV